jgi:hypothetical protein
MAGAVRCNDRIDVDLAALAVDAAVAAEYRVKKCAAVIRHLVGVVETDRLPVIDPLQWHSGDVRSQHLLRDIGSDSCKHWYTSSCIARPMLA